MAFWIRKNAPNKSDQGKESESGMARKRKEEKTRQQVKRLDNLRIPHQLPVLLRSLGSRNDFSFVTKDLSSSGMFVLCPNFQNYPFQAASTILDCEVNLGAQSHPPHSKIRFFGKIARVTEESDAQREGQSMGFGVRIVQIAHEARIILENYISAHGTPDLNSVAAAEMRFQARKNEQSELEPSLAIQSAS